MLIGSNSKARVVLALIAGGYGETQDITSAQFVGETGTGKEIHRITFPDPETGRQGSGHVYVWVEGGTLVGDF